MNSLQILCLEHVFDSALHILRDVLETAASLAERSGGKSPIRLGTVTLDGKPVRTAAGQMFTPDDSIKNLDSVDVLFVPGFRCMNVDDVLAYLNRDFVPETLQQIRQAFEAGAEIATACTGAWILAEAGLLAGKQATTTWHLGMSFQQHYPDVRLQLEKMVTVDGRIRCAGSAMAHMDLAISVVSARCGGEIGREVASMLLLDQRPSQAHYMVANHLSGNADDFKVIDRWARDNIDHPFSIGELAEGTGFSERTLARRVKEATGETPIRYVQRLRVNHAIFLLETSSLSFSRISRNLGYSEPASLRRLIRQQTGRAPSDFRRA